MPPPPLSSPSLPAFACAAAAAPASFPHPRPSLPASARAGKLAALPARAVPLAGEPRLPRLGCASSTSGRRAQTVAPRARELRPPPLAGMLRLRPCRRDPTVVAPVLPLPHDSPAGPHLPSRAAPSARREVAASIGRASSDRRLLAGKIGSRPSRRAARAPALLRPPARGAPPVQPRRPASLGRSPSRQARFATYHRRDGAGRRGTRPPGGATGKLRQRHRGDWGWRLRKIYQSGSISFPQCI
jgi:hypothetical protein